jgi:arylformamidase
MIVHDITVAITPGCVPVWPGDPQPERTLIWQMANNSAANVSLLTMSAHTATHVDAPIHFIPGGAGMERLDVSVLVGPCRVAALDTGKRHIAAADLNALALPAGTQRLLLKTSNSQLWQQHGAAFQHDFVALTADAARWIVEYGIRLVGIDYLSVEPFDNAEPVVHRTLLGAGVIVLEGIDLTGIEPADYLLACLPLKVVGSDGAPARVVLISER